MLCYITICDNHTGAFVGAVILNRETLDAAAQAAGDIAVHAGAPHCLQIAVAQVPAGPQAIPPEAMNRLLSYAELERYFGEVRTLTEEEREGHYIIV